MYFGNLWLRINIPNRNKMASGRNSFATNPEDSRTKRLSENQPSASPPPRGTWDWGSEEEAIRMQCPARHDTILSIIQVYQVAKSAGK